jgi:hypothetical protein
VQCLHRLMPRVRRYSPSRVVTAVSGVPQSSVTGAGRMLLLARGEGQRRVVNEVLFLWVLQCCCSGPVRGRRAHATAVSSSALYATGSVHRPL